MIKEYINKIILKKTLIIGAIVSLLSFAMAFLNYKTGDNISFYIMITTGVICLLTVLLLPTLTFKEFKSKAKAIHGSDTAKVTLKQIMTILI